MRRLLLALTMFALVGSVYPLVQSATAQVTAEQRKELGDLRSELGKVAALIREKNFDEAESILAKAEEQLESIATAAGVQTTDRSLQGIAPLIKRHRDSLEKAIARAGGTPANTGVSFSTDVAPIINDACLNCHGANNPRANLRLDTFAGWKQGGRSGPLLAVGNANNSLLIARLRAPNPNDRMPRNANALPNDDIQTIATWINQGAKFDGDAEDTMLADLAAAAENDPSIIIPKPDGDETVSFTRDIAPFMANLCGGCHSRQQMNGGLCLETFYDMMKGGDSGRVVLPGNREGSRLYRLVGGLENPRMPQGQARITRKNYEDLTKWFDEGCVYDGEDPKTPLRQFVRTEAEMEADRFASMSPEEMDKFRIDRTDSQFKRAVPNDSFNTLKGDQFYLIGNVSPDRLRQVDEWSQAHVANLTKIFSGGDGQIWRGRLAIFVMKDRFSYDEFNLVINGREAPKEMTGHSIVTPTSEDAYIVLLDVGDEATNETSALRVNLIDHLTGAYLNRSGATLPDWVIRGTGLALAAKALPGDPYLRQLPLLAKQNVASLNRPEDVFANGTFSPGTIGPVGYSLVDYMLDEGGSARFAQFIKALESGQDAAAAVRAVYNADLASLARGYVRSLN